MPDSQEQGLSPQMGTTATRYAFFPLIFVDSVTSNKANLPGLNPACQVSMN
ncbi:hypothetical protein K1T71_003739 [Dendrolimus kikuchii]|uniref:Uncharacterized protein n=1 Tax=Dendrolimus kikuchii TaxID=765133 RepID=A0ACC1D940_9NEOP|nr:hypothetical protein K1T71_003739 [Dendrolimus kikuchii]